MPKNSKTGGNVVRKPNLLLKLLPTKDKDYYQFRLLNFTIPDSKRDFPFVEKNIHEAWAKDNEGKSVYKGYVTCPTTNYIKQSAGRGVSLKCPICEYVNQNFVALKNTNYTDKDLQSVVNKNKVRSIVCIPVYVIKDPHNPLNNAKPRVIVLRLENKDDKEFYKTFLKSIDNVLKTSVDGVNLSPFNGEANSVNLIAQVGHVTTIVKKGTPDEYEYTKVKIQKLAFGKQPRAIDAISEEMIENFPFDDNFFTTSSADEINNFFSEYVMGGVKEAVEDVDLGNDDDLITGDSVAETVVTPPPTESTEEDLPDLDELDDILNTPTTPTTKSTTQTKPQSKPQEEHNQSIDEICADLGLD